MPVWAQHRYGGPEVVALEQVPVPNPGPGEVLVEVAASSLNSADARLLRGDPALIRLAFGLRRPSPVRGRDVAGVVVAVGPGVGPGAGAGAGASPHAVGDRVAGELPGGGLGAYVVGAASALAAVPASVPLEVAATVPLAGGTAWQALDAGRVVHGSRVLVVGAGGGVGTFTVALAAHRGARVHAIGGARSLEVLRGLGAEEAADHRSVDLRTWAPDAFDAVVDVVGTTPLRTLRRLVRPGGLVVGVGGGTDRVIGPLGRMLAGAVQSVGSTRRFRPLAARTDAALTARLLALVADGLTPPPIERTWPFGEARAALAHIDAGHTVGKIIVTGAVR